MKTKYTVMGYNTDHYDVKSEYKEFTDIGALWKWCKNFLSLGNRAVVVHCTERRFSWGMNRDKGKKQVKKIGVFRDISQLPKW